MSQNPIYTNIDALKPIERLVTEAGSAIADPSRITSDDIQINEALTAAGGIGAGAALGFAGLYFGGSVVGLSAAGITSGLAAAGAIVGGGMVLGIAVLAAPAVLLGVAGYAITANYNHQKLQKKKEMLLQAILCKHNAIISELSKTSQQNQERVEYLTRLNTLLQAAITDLKHDLGTHAA